MITRLLNGAGLVGGAKAGKLDTLYTREQMSLFIQRERNRAERNGHEYALAVFKIENAGRRDLMRLAKLLRTRARTTDDIGWYDDGSLCALLPDTPSWGAETFAEAVCAAARGLPHRPTFVIYSYTPDASDKHNDHHSGGTGGGGGGGHVNNDRRGRGPRVSEPAALAIHRRGEFRPTGPQHERMEHLLAQPLPAWKRTLDVVGASVALVIFSPLILASAVAVRVSSPGPVLFFQRRAGLGGKPFTMLKFRSMVVDAEERKAELMKLNEQDGPAFKLTNDPRVTRVGKFLRKTSLDELPQLINVLKGEMSLVGPRPLPCKEQEGCVQWRRERLDVTPGLTCIWQVKGRSSVSFDEWVRMDVQYIRSRTIVNDLKIIAQTVLSVAARKGAR